MITVNDLLKLAIEGHSGAQRWEQISRFRVAAPFLFARSDFVTEE